MKTYRFLTLILGISMLQLSQGQSSKENARNQEFSFTENYWKVENSDGSQGEVKNVVFKNKSSLHLGAGQTAFLKDQKYRNFVIEFYCSGLSGPGFGFRIQDKKNYEYIYLRLSSSGKKDAIQYLPIYNGSLPWQLYNYPKYEGSATYFKEKIGKLPIAIEDQLIEGNLNAKLLSAFKENQISVSNGAKLFKTGGNSRVVYDSVQQNLFEINKLNNTFEVRDFRTWNHLKVAVVQDQASIYVENMEEPAFVVNNLVRDIAEGGISFLGDFSDVYFADVSIGALRHSKSINTPSKEEPLSKDYLTGWKLSEMFTKDSVNLISQIDSLSQPNTKLKTIEADENGLINISRFYNDMTKTVALTCHLESDSDKTVKLNFDYADHLVILLDSNILFDKGMDFAPPAGKGEEGRVFVDDESVELNLKKGENKLVFVLSADNRQKFNWGFIAKLEDIDGIAIK